MSKAALTPNPFPRGRGELMVTPTGQALFEQWETWGLKPTEVATEELEQRITIKHNALTGQVEWKTEKLDGVQALGLLAQTMHSMFQYFVKNQVRPKFSSGQAKVAIFLDENRLTVGLEPLHDPLVVKGALLAALWEVIERSTAGGDELKGWESLFETRVAG